MDKGGCLYVEIKYDDYDDDVTEEKSPNYKQVEDSKEVDNEKERRSSSRYIRNPVLKYSR